MKLQSSQTDHCAGLTPCRWEASLCPAQFVAPALIATSYAPSLLHILSSQIGLFWSSLFGNNNPKCLEQAHSNFFLHRNCLWVICSLLTDLRFRLNGKIANLSIPRVEQGKVRMGRILGLIEFAVMSRFRRRNHKLANLEERASRGDGCPFGVASDRLGWGRTST